MPSLLGVVAGAFEGEHDHHALRGHLELRDVPGHAVQVLVVKTAGMAEGSGVDRNPSAVRGRLGLGCAPRGAGFSVKAMEQVTGLPCTGAPGWYTVPIFVAVAGLVMGNATALALAGVPHAAGTASALLGALQFGLAGVVSPLVSIGGEHTAAPLAAVMVSTAAIALLGHLLSGENRRKSTAAPI